MQSILCLKMEFKMDKKERTELLAIQKQIGIKLSEFRIRNEITLKTLSRKTEISEQALSLYEIGQSEISLKELVVLSFYFECSVHDFFMI